MEGRKPEGAVHGGSLTTDSDAQSQKSCDTERGALAVAQGTLSNLDEGRDSLTLPEVVDA